MKIMKIDEKDENRRNCLVRGAATEDTTERTITTLIMTLSLNNFWIFPTGIILSFHLSFIIIFIVFIVIILI